MGLAIIVIVITGSATVKTIRDKWNVIRPRILITRAITVRARVNIFTTIKMLLTY